MDQRANNRLLMYCLVGMVAWGLLGINTSCSSAARESTERGTPVERTQTMTGQTNPNIGMKFPEVTAESLAGTKVSIPDSALGKITLVVVAFLRENQSQLDSWLEPFIEKFGNREGFTFYEVPMIAGGYRIMRFIIDGGMRGGIPEPKHKHVVTMYGDVDGYLNALRLDRQYGYAFLLDKAGIIRWQGQGFSTQESRNKLFETAEKLAQAE
jgi:hypothetical protein